MEWKVYNQLSIIINIEMVEYRQNINETQSHMLLKKYEKHLDAYGGIFTPDKRRKLLGINPNNSQPLKDNPNFWYDVRRGVENALIDLGLFCSVASSDQVKKVFKLPPPIPPGVYTGTEDIFQVRPSLSGLISTLMWLHADEIGNPKNYLWKAELASELVSACMHLFRFYGLTSSQVHQNVLFQVEDVLRSELVRIKSL